MKSGFHVSGRAGRRCCSRSNLARGAIIGAIVFLSFNMVAATPLPYYLPFSPPPECPCACDSTMVERTHVWCGNDTTKCAVQLNLCGGQSALCRIEFSVPDSEVVGCSPGLCSTQWCISGLAGAVQRVACEPGPGGSHRIVFEFISSDSLCPLLAPCAQATVQIAPSSPCRWADTLHYTLKTYKADACCPALLCSISAILPPCPPCPDCEATTVFAHKDTCQGDSTCGFCFTIYSRSTVVKCMDLVFPDSALDSCRFNPGAYCMGLPTWIHVVALPGPAGHTLWRFCAYSPHNLVDSCGSFSLCIQPPTDPYCQLPDTLHWCIITHGVSFDTLCDTCGATPITCWRPPCPGCLDMRVEPVKDLCNGDSTCGFCIHAFSRAERVYCIGFSLPDSEWGGYAFDTSKYCFSIPSGATITIDSSGGRTRWRICSGTEDPIIDSCGSAVICIHPKKPTVFKDLLHWCLETYNHESFIVCDTCGTTRLCHTCYTCTCDSIKVKPFKTVCDSLQKCGLEMRLCAPTDTVWYFQLRLLYHELTGCIDSIPPFTLDHWCIGGDTCGTVLTRNSDTLIFTFCHHDSVPAMLPCSEPKTIRVTPKDPCELASLTHWWLTLYGHGSHGELTTVCHDTGAVGAVCCFGPSIQSLPHDTNVTALGIYVKPDTTCYTPGVDTCRKGCCFSFTIANEWLRNSLTCLRIESDDSTTVIDGVCDPYKVNWGDTLHSHHDWAFDSCWECDTYEDGHPIRRTRDTAQTPCGLALKGITISSPDSSIHHIGGYDALHFGLCLNNRTADSTCYRIRLIANYHYYVCERDTCPHPPGHPHPPGDGCCKEVHDTCSLDTLHLCICCDSSYIFLADSVHLGYGMHRDLGSSYGLIPIVAPPSSTLRIVTGIDRDAPVDVFIYDGTGRLVADRHSSISAGGKGEFAISTEGLRSGTYSCMIRVDGIYAIQRMLIVR